MMSLSPASSDFVEHISAHIGSLPSARRFAPYFSYSTAVLSGSGPPAAIGTFVHLAARAEIADPGILRRAEWAGVEAIAAADAQILGVQDNSVGRGVEQLTGHTAAHGASVQCMQAIETERSPGLPSLMVTTRRRLMPHGTSFSFLQAVTQALHSMQRSASQRNFIRAMICLLTLG